jgi:hypothetical protein
MSVLAIVLGYINNTPPKGKKQVSHRPLNTNYMMNQGREEPYRKTGVQFIWLHLIRGPTAFFRRRRALTDDSVTFPVLCGGTPPKSRQYGFYAKDKQYCFQKFCVRKFRRIWIDS